MLTGAKPISLAEKNSLLGDILCFGGAAGSPAQKILGPKLCVLSPTRTAVTSGLNLLGKKMKIIGDFSREQFSKASHRILDVGEPCVG